MRRYVFCVAAGFAAVSYGWGLGDALNAVDKATSTVNDANNAVKSVTQQPQQAATDSAAATDVTAGAKDAATTQTASAAPSATSAPTASASSTPASALKWDAAGYAVKLAKVNEAMPKVTPKMPLRGEPEQWYNAAYQLTSIDKQYSFLPPAQRVNRISPYTQAGVDKFLAWAEGGMQDASNDPIVGGSEIYRIQGEIDREIYAAERKGYSITPPAWTKSAESYKGKRYSEIEKMKAEIRTLINESKGKVMAAANEALQKKVDERNALIGRCEEAALAIDDAVKGYQKERDQLFLQCSQAFGRMHSIPVEKQYKSYAEYATTSTAGKDMNPLAGLNGADQEADLKVLEEQMKFETYTSALREVFDDKSDQKFVKEMMREGDEFSKNKDKEYPLNKKFAVQEKILPGEESSKSREIAADEYTEKDLDSDISSLSSEESRLKNSANQCKEKGQKRLIDQSNKVAENIGRWIDSTVDIALTQRHDIDMEFRNVILAERGKYGEQTLKKVDEIAQKLIAEIDKNKKLAAERENLIAKLASSDIGAWLPDIQKVTKGDKQNALFADALKRKYGAKAAKGDDVKKLRTLVNDLYSQEEQDKLLYDYKTPISLVIGIADTVEDLAFRKKLLVDNTKWALDILRADASAEDNQYAYLTLLSHETDMAILMAVYEGQDRVKFTYDENAKKDGEMTAGDALVKMWTDQRNANGAGYGRLGLWMLDHCSKDFCKRVEKMADARRKVAKRQTFLMKDYYLGMPHRDSKLVMKNWDKKKGSVKASFGTFNNGTLSEISFGAKARLEYLGVKKDGLTGLGQFVEKYIPGGMESVGELKVGAKADLGYDPENPEVEINTWWYTDCPKYDCRIRMYDSGTISVISTSDDDSPKLDFSSVK